jgi:uncharacterized UPF0160 family protein
MIKIDTKKPFKRVGTHDGRFHADEVMATAILNKIFEIEIVRTRDTKILDALDIVYDVGGGEFDHHGLEKVYREDGIPFAACGLIWNRFGRDVIYMEDPSLTEDDIESVFYYVDRTLIEGIDAQDNGIKTVVEEIVPSMNISTIISGFNPLWYSEGMENEAFNEAVKIGASILKNTIKLRLAIIQAKDVVVQAYKKRNRLEVLVLDTYCPWEETIQDIDEEDQVIFVVYPNKDKYAMQTVKDKDGRTKKPLPKAWAGKENEELSNITGVEDAIFCHTGRFIAVAGSFEGIMKMTELAINCVEDEDLMDS